MIVAVGLFAVGEALHMAAKLRKGDDEELLDPDQAAEELDDPEHVQPAPLAEPRETVKRSWKPWLRGAAIGFPFGALPAGGAELPTFLSYSVEKQLAKRPEEFGKGAIEGVAGPEAANNASFSGTLVPLLTLGPADVGDRGDYAGRVPDLQPAARARSSSTAAQRPGLDARRVAVRRQPDAAAPQPAVDPPCG